MRFEWDEDKNRRNRAKHKVSFETASLVFDDQRSVSVPDRMVEGEERWVTMGLAGGVVLLVAHAYRGKETEEAIRIIPARKATPHERRIYEESCETYW